MKKRIVFWGTPEHAKKVVSVLFEDPGLEIVAVVTMPDKPVGRKQILTPSPVKEWAREKGIEVFTPENLNEGESSPDRGRGQALYRLQEISPDFFVVVAYGKIIPRKILDIPKYGAFNLHFSLLPKYRGASPVQTALLHGDSTSGITLFRLTEGMDEGPMVVQKPYSFGGNGFCKALEEMTDMGITALLEFLSAPKNFPEIPQNHAFATYCHKILKEDGEIVPESDTCETALQKYRAFEMWPGVFSFLPGNGMRVKYTKLSPAQNISSTLPVGSFFLHDKKCFLALSKGCLEVFSVVPEGKKEMNGTEFFHLLSTGSFS